MHVNDALRTEMTLQRLLVACVFFSCLVPVSSAQDGGKPVYELPENQNEIVFVFDQRNGFTPPRETDKPVFSLRADGTIEMPKLYGPGHDITGKLTPEELQEFLHFVISDCQFLKFDANTVQGQIEEIRKKKRVPQIADAPDSVFELHLPGKNLVVRQEAIGMPEEFKEVTALQRLFSLRAGVMKLMSETRVGGAGGIKWLVGKLNENMKFVYTDEAPLEPDHFISSRFGHDGEILATFARRGHDKNGKFDGSFLNAWATLKGKYEDPTFVYQRKLKSRR